MKGVLALSPNLLGKLRKAEIIGNARVEEIVKLKLINVGTRSK